MTTASLKCFGCDGQGHIERDCPTSAVVATGGGQADKPMWCGRCDRRTRLIEMNGLADRCQECHPLAHRHKAQFIRCPGCRVLVYVWDGNPCGQHAAPLQPADTRPEREEIAAIVAGETKRRGISDEPENGAA